MSETEIVALDHDAIYDVNGFAFTPVMVGTRKAGAVRDNGTGRFTAFAWKAVVDSMVELGHHDSVLAALADIVEEIKFEQATEAAYQASLVALRR